MPKDQRPDAGVALADEIEVLRRNGFCRGRTVLLIDYVLSELSASTDNGPGWLIPAGQPGRSVVQTPAAPEDGGK